MDNRNDFLKECDRRIHEGRPGMGWRSGQSAAAEDYETCERYLTLGSAGGVNANMYAKAFSRLNIVQRFRLRSAAEQERRHNG